MLRRRVLFVLMGLMLNQNVYAQMGEAYATIEHAGDPSGMPGQLYAYGDYDLGNNGAYISVRYTEVDPTCFQEVTNGLSGEKAPDLYGGFFWTINLADFADAIEPTKTYRIDIVMHYNDLSTQVMGSKYGYVLDYNYSIDCWMITSPDPGEVSASGMYTFGLNDNVVIVMWCRQSGTTEWQTDAPGTISKIAGLWTYESDGFTPGQSWEFKPVMYRPGQTEPIEPSSTLSITISEGGMGGGGMGM